MAVMNDSIMNTSATSRSGKKRAILISATLAAALCLGLVVLFSRMEYPWNWRTPWEYRRLYLQGFYYTVSISACAIVLGLCLGVAGGLARISQNLLARQAAKLYVEIFRGTPLLVQLYIFYFCIAAAIHYDNPVVIGIVALAAFSGAYITEMVRAGVESVGRGQMEAALSTGLTRRQALRLVIFPQALRRILPPVTGQFVSLIKDSSLLSVISVRELTKASEVVNATTYRTFEAYLPLAFIYLLLTFPLSQLTQRLERRFRAD